MKRLIERITLSVLAWIAVFILVCLLVLAGRPAHGQEFGPYYPNILNGSTPPVPGYVAYWDPASIKTNNGSIITSWPDSAWGNVITLTGSATWSAQLMNGQPGVFIPSGGYGVDSGFFGKYPVNTNFTMFLTVINYRNPIAAYVWSDATAAVYNQFFVQDVVSGPQQTGYMSGTNGYSFDWSTPNSMQVAILCVRYDGNAYSVYLNGYKEADSTILNGFQNTPEPNGIGVGGDFNLASLGGASSTGWTGLFGRIIVYNTALTQQQINSDFGFLLQYYNVVANIILLEGDSVTYGLASQSHSNLEDFVAQAFPTFQIVNMAQNGRNTLGILTNELNWAGFGGNNNGGIKIAGLMERVNDDEGGQNIAFTETNDLLWSNVAKTNGWRTFICTIPSYSFGDNNGTRTNYNQNLRTNFFNLGYNQICDYAAVTNIGAVGACSNLAGQTLFLTDLTHPLAKGYAYMSNTLVNTIQSLINPATVWNQAQPPIMMPFDTNRVPCFWNSNSSGYLFWVSEAHTNLIASP